MTELKLFAENINKEYYRHRRKITALQPTGFEASEGEFAVILGRSGSGKTTLLNILAGLLTPGGGNIRYDDTDIYSLSDKELSAFRSRHIGYIPQGHSLVGSLTVRENILLPAALAGSEPVEDADVLLEKLGLSELADAYPKELSGGELRRAAIARALINSPEVIFADEPTNDLDDENTGAVFELLKKLAGEGHTVIAVTHDSAAADFADTVYRMDSGMLNTKEGHKREIA